MSTLSYKGKLSPGTQEKIRLRTLNGKRGYKIRKFSILPITPGASGATVEYVSKITKIKATSIIADVDFTDSTILAVAYYQDHENAGYAYKDIIFDNEKFNQDIYVQVSDAGSSSLECNYYIELETTTLSDTEATMLTLRNIKDVVSSE